MSVTSPILQAALEGDLSTFREVQLCCGFTDHAAAHYLGVSLRTLRRWRATLSPPLSALRLLAIRAGACPWPGWEGWEVHTGYLFAPGQTRRGFKPGHVMSVTFLHAQIRNYKQQLADLDAEIERLRAELAALHKARAFGAR